MKTILSIISKIQNLTVVTKITLVTTGIIVTGSATTVAIAIVSNSQAQTDTSQVASENPSETTPENDTAPKQDSTNIEEETTESSTETSDEEDATQHDDENSQNKDTNSVTNSTSGAKPSSSNTGAASSNNSCTIQEYGVTLGAYSRPGCQDYLKCDGLYVSANGENAPNYFMCKKDYPDYECNRYGKTSVVCIESKMIGWSTSARPAHMGNFIYYQSNKLQGTYRVPNFASYNMPKSNVFRLSSDAEKRATSLITSHDNIVVEMGATEQNGKWTVVWGAYVREQLDPEKYGENNYVVRWTHGKDYVKSAEKSAIDNLAMQYQNEIQQWQNLYTSNFLSWYR